MFWHFRAHEGLRKSESKSAAIRVSLAAMRTASIHTACHLEEQAVTQCEAHQKPHKQDDQPSTRTVKFTTCSAAAGRARLDAV